MLQSISSFGAGVTGRAETTEAMTSLAPSAPYSSAQAKMRRWCESLVDEQISHFAVLLGDFQLVFRPSEPFFVLPQGF